MGTDSFSLKARRIAGKVARAASPGYSSCYRCGMPWSATTEHSTWYTRDSACFPLCEPCWKETTIDERIPFYEQLVVSWENGDPYKDYSSERELILAAVMAGK